MLRKVRSVAFVPTYHFHPSSFQVYVMIIRDSQHVASNWKSYTFFYDILNMIIDLHLTKEHASSLCI